MTIAMQIRDVPEEVRDRLAAQAKKQGQSLQSYLLALVITESEMLGKAQAFERTARFRTDLSALDPIGIIRHGRDEGAELDRVSP